jgi:hypothetical protein
LDLISFKEIFDSTYLAPHRDFLAMHPHPALLPIYYLRPLMVHYDHADTFDHVVVWVQHGPVIIWLARDWILRRGQTVFKNES